MTAAAILPQALAWLAAGAAMGAAFLYLVARSVAAIRRPGARGAAAGFLVLRMALAVAVFTLAARQGALPLVSALAGFLVARTVAIRRMREG